VWDQLAFLTPRIAAPVSR
jgi:hypothetical protein